MALRIDKVKAVAEQFSDDPLEDTAALFRMAADILDQAEEIGLLDGTPLRDSDGNRLGTIVVQFEEYDPDEESEATPADETEEVTAGTPDEA